MKRATLVDAALLLALLALPLVAGAFGSPLPQVLRLNLGPFDEPWTLGFSERHEVTDKVGVHWSSPEAAVHWPVWVRADGLQLRYRVSRVLPETAEVVTSLGGAAVDRFSCRGGAWLERTAVAAARGQDLQVSFTIDSHDRRGLGLLFDWIEVTVPPGNRVGLAPAWALRGAACAALATLLLLGLGWPRRAALATGVVVAIAASVGFVTRPWTTVLLLRGVPEGLLVFGGAGVLLARGLRARFTFDGRVLARVGAIALLAFCVRATALNHPDWYYPDLMVHTKLALDVREVGPGFLLHPAQHVEARGAWTKPVWGGQAALPYTVTWHAPFALLGLSYDATLQVMKTAAAAASVIPLLVAAAMAGAFGASPVLAALLMLAIPTYLSRMSVALLPALLGHAADMLVLLALMHWTPRLREPGVALRAALVIALGYLSYVSSVTNLSSFIGLLALTVALVPPRRPADAVRLLAAGLGGAALAVALYYRDFLWPLLALPASTSTAASVYAATGFLDFLWLRTYAFFDVLHPLLALLGLGFVLRRRTQPAFALAWFATYLGLILLRAKVPDVFRYGHETVFVTPLVCLLSARALGEARERSGLGAAVATAIVGLLLLQGAAAQWQALVAQLANAL